MGCGLVVSSFIMSKGLRLTQFLYSCACLCCVMGCSGEAVLRVAHMGMTPYNGHHEGWIISASTGKASLSEPQVIT